MNVFTELQWRGLVHQATADNLGEILAKEKFPVYIGFDPTATSLHAGSLIPLMALRHFQRCGHPVIVLIGGATGLIGDPSGKSEERILETVETVRARGQAMQRQIEGFLSAPDGPPPKFVNNLDWLGDFKLLEFLRDIGKHFSVNEMIHKDSVKKRFEKEGAGISYTEFTYMLLQASDFLELYRRHGCRIQCGASDQWGNICEGIALIRRVEQFRRGEAYGLTMPLLTNSEGKKMGKSEKGAIWLDPKQTSPYAFYQFWINMADADVARFLRWFTLLDEAAIKAIEPKIGTGERIAQKTLAQEITMLVHGKDEMENAKKASEALFSGDIASLPVTLLKQLDVPKIALTPQELGAAMPLIDLLVKCQACSSKADARRNLAQKGVRLNGKQPAGENPMVSAADFLEGEVLVVQRGKRNNYLVLREAQ